MDSSSRGLETYIITKVLKDCGGNKSKAARVLGVKRTTLVMKLKSI